MIRRLRRFSQRVQTRLRTQIHDAVGDGRGRECLFTQFHAGQYFELPARSENHDLTVLADAIQAPLDPNGGAVELASDAFPPMLLSSCCVDAGDDAAVGP